MAELARHQERFRQQQRRLAVIGSGAVRHLPDFRQATGYHGELYTDPSRDTFKLMGFSAGLGGVVGLQPLKKAVGALTAGFRPGALQGNALQLGGAAIIDPEGTLRYYFKSSEAGDHPDIEALLAPLAEVAG